MLSKHTHNNDNYNDIMPHNIMNNIINIVDIPRNRSHSKANVMSNVRFTQIDLRRKGVLFEKSRGVMFMCRFGREDFLIGSHNKLWCLHSNKSKNGYKNDWPWACLSNRVLIEICWSPYIPMHPTECTFVPHEYTARCLVSEKRGKRLVDVHSGWLENLNHLLIRLQRWSRRMVKRRRVVALCMGTHERLGAQCVLCGMGSDMLLVICSYL